MIYGIGIAFLNHYNSKYVHLCFIVTAEEFEQQREFESLLNISAYVTSNIPLDSGQTEKQEAEK